LSDSDEYTLDFRKIKDKEVQRQMDMEDLEWEHALGSSPEPDGLHYQMLKELLLHAKKELLKGYNQVWEGRAFQEEWTEALIVPVLKPGKDKSCVTSYRSISVNCLKKW
jgi:hypothetical protein